MKYKKNQQKIKVGRTLEGTLFEIAFLILTILLWALIAWLINKAPHLIPTHYDFQGNITSYGSPWTMMPAYLILTIIGGCLLAGAYFPHTINVPVKVETPRQFTHVIRMARIMAIEILLLTLCIVLETLGIAIGISLPTGVLTISSAVVLISTAIAYTILIYKAR